MSLTLITLNHSVLPNFWHTCLNGLQNQNHLIKYFDLNICDFWNTYSNFDYWTRIDYLISEENPTHLVFLAADLGTILLKSWLENNQKLASQFSIDAIFIDSPSFEDWIDTRYTKELSEMDRATYIEHLQKSMRNKAAPEELIQALPAQANFLKALIVQVHKILEQKSDDNLWLPRLESWHELKSVSPPLASGASQNEASKNIPNWMTTDFIFSKTNIKPSMETATKIQTLLLNILRDMN